MHPRSPLPDPLRLLRHWRKLFWLCTAIVVLASGDMLLAKYGPDLTTATVETGASFSVSAGSFATEARAATFASALDSSGLPILVHMRPEDGRFQVMVGPYVTTDEAEHAQRKLAAWGLGESRLLVDDTMRTRPQQASLFGFGESERNSVVMVSAAGMSSLVFEMHAVPKQVESKRTGPTTIDVEIGTSADATPRARLRLPDGVSLVRELSIASGSDAMHAHLVVPKDIESRLRLEGRRVYVDFAFPKAPWSIRHVAAPEAKHEAEPAKAVAAPAASVDMEQQLNAAVARFTQLEPFLTSAVESPEPEVLAALTHSLEDLRASLPATYTSPALESTRQTLVAATNQATIVLAPTFTGDRRAGMQLAVALAHSR